MIPLLIPGRLYDTVIAPNATGNWSAGPFIPFVSVGVSEGSLPAKSTVADCRSATPVPEPTGLKLTVSPWPLRFEPHCW